MLTTFYALFRNHFYYLISASVLLHRRGRTRCVNITKLNCVNLVIIHNILYIRINLFVLANNYQYKFITNYKFCSKKVALNITIVMHKHN